MKSTELRVGNFVSVDGKTLPVTQIFEKGLNCGNVGALYELVKPIPLTEEWLKRFGFESQHAGHYYNNINEEFYVFCNGTDCGIAFQEIEHGVDDIDYERVLSITIDRVHQLQNLYFALTGEELNQNKEDE